MMTYAMTIDLFFCLYVWYLCMVLISKCIPAVTRKPVLIFPPLFALPFQ